MWQRCAVMLVALAAPGVCVAQNKLDDLLPAGSQIYFQWDGVEKHKDAADKLAVMKMWRGETGDFLRGVWKQIETVGKQALAAELNAELAGAVFDEFGGMLRSVGNKGFAFGAELRGVTPFQFQATLVFPNGAGKAKTPLSFINTMSRLDKELKIQTAKQGQREVQFIQAEPVYLAWWAEGNDAVWSVGTTAPPTLLKELEDQKQPLSTRPLYKQVHAFKEYPVWLRGFFELPPLARLAAQVHPSVNPIADALGLTTIKNCTFYSGFDGPAERAVTLVELDKGPRKGLTKLISTKTFALQDLPPMPHDLTGFSAATMDWPGAYDATVDVAGTLINQLSPFGGVDVKEAIKGFEQNHNISLSGIFNELDPLYVNYAASAEGPLGLGQTQLLKVKNGQKLEQELAKLLKVIEREGMGLVEVSQSKYQGATIHRVSIGAPGAGGLGIGAGALQQFNLTVHKGWLVLSNYPQALKGYILRANGELPTWKADKELQTRLDAFPKEFTGISVSDPRPTLKFVLSILPAAIDITQMAVEQGLQGQFPFKRFDVGLVPNAYQATKDLFPNITVTTINGDTIRSETRASLALPF